MGRSEFDTHMDLESSDAILLKYLIQTMFEGIEFTINPHFMPINLEPFITWIYTYLIVARFLYALWCGSLLFYLLQRQCEKPVSKIKQIVFPHLFYLCSSLGTDERKYPNYD